MKKTFSKALALFMAVLMLVGQMTFIATAADEYVKCVKCNQTKATFVRHIDGNCGYWGYDVFVCANNKCPSKGETYPVLAEKPTGLHTPAGEATCTEDAICSVCNQVAIEALDHDYIRNVVPTDCETDGITYVTCRRCDYSDEIPGDKATGHKWVKDVENSREPICTPNGFEGGYAIYVCENANCPVGTYRDELDAPEKHLDYTATYVAPTCEEDGYWHCVCTTCGYELDEPDYGSALGHDLKDQDGQYYDCFTEGWDPYKACTRCDYNEKVVTGNFKHSITKDVYLKDESKQATCTEDGLAVIAKMCKYCDNYEVSRTSTVLKAPGHKLVKNADKSSKLSCCTDGFDFMECSKCDYTETQNFVAADKNLHVEDFDREPDKEATCAEEGFEGRVWCAVCGEILNPGITIPKLPHTPSGEATCTDNVVCTECGEELEAELGHNHGVSLGYVPASCLDAAYDLWKCDRCEEYFREYIYEDQPALGHDLKWERAKLMTCTEDGWGSYQQCTRCDYNTKVIIPAECDMVSYEQVDPTCTENGTTEGMKCSVCGAIGEGLKALPPLGHDFYTDTTPATIDAVGYNEVKCTRCDYSEIEYLDEEIEITYKTYGINGTDVAVNSGYITVEIYMNVVTDFARVYGVDFAFDFNGSLEYLGGEGALTDDILVRLIDSNTVKFTANNINNGTVAYAKGEYLVATLTFKVDGGYSADEAVFSANMDEFDVSRDTTLPNVLNVTVDEVAAIDVVMLGDANNDGKITTTDAEAFFSWFLAADADAYNVVFDMDKNGVINGIDEAILRGAIVGINDYLYA